MFVAEIEEGLRKMGKVGKWFGRIFMGKKDDEKPRTHVSCCSVAPESPRTPLSVTSKEKRRWNFRTSSAKAALPKDQITFEAENEQKKHALAVVAAAALICLNSSTNSKASLDQEAAAAATRIQSCFRSYLAKKVLRALRGIVKLQALVRGHLVRKQATTTLQCMQSLITAQDRARALRIQIVEIDMGEHSNHGFSMQIPAWIEQFEGSSFVRAQTSPLSAISKSDHSRVPFAFPRSEYAESVSYDDPKFPNYMSNTESSMAKVRSQSAPKSRPDSFERQTSWRKQSVDRRNARMQRSASQVCFAAQNYQHHRPIELDKSTVSCKDSECGFTYSVLTASNYHRSSIAKEETEIINLK